MRLVSFDGGGVRGIVSAVIAEQIEGLLDAPLCEHADRLAGTSVGAILACAFATGMRASEVLEAMRRLAPEIFARFFRRFGRRLLNGPRYWISGPRHDGATLERALCRVFDPSLRFGDLQRPVDVTVYDVIRGQFLTLSSDFGLARELPVWEVCKASASAQVYFPAHVTEMADIRVALIDGGNGANSPAAISIVRAHMLRLALLEEISCVSIGTGAPRWSVGAEEAQERGALEWLADLTHVFLDASSDAHQQIAAGLLPRGRHHRLQIELPDSLMAMDDARPAQLQGLESRTRAYMGRPSQHAKLRAAADALA